MTAMNSIAIVHEARTKYQFTIELLPWIIYIIMFGFCCVISRPFIVSSLPFRPFRFGPFRPHRYLISLFSLMENVVLRTTGTRTSNVEWSTCVGCVCAV